MRSKKQPPRVTANSKELIELWIRIELLLYVFLIGEVEKVLVTNLAATKCLGIFVYWY